MSSPVLQSLRDALLSLSRAIDWSTYDTAISDPGKLQQIACSWFHKKSTDLQETVENVLLSQTDEDRVHFAEIYADAVLSMTDLKDAIWFRKGVWIKEALPTTLYPRHRDHSVHTFHNEERFSLGGVAHDLSARASGRDPRR